MIVRGYFLNQIFSFDYGSNDDAQIVGNKYQTGVSSTAS